MNGLCKSCGQWRRLVVQVVVSVDPPAPGVDLAAVPTGYICEPCAEDTLDDEAAFAQLFKDCPICALDGSENHH